MIRDSSQWNQVCCFTMNASTACQNASPPSIPSSTGADSTAAPDLHCRRLPFSDLARHSSDEAALVVLVRPATPPRVLSDMVRHGGLGAHHLHVHCLLVLEHLFRRCHLLPRGLSPGPHPQSSLPRPATTQLPFYGTSYPILQKSWLKYVMENTHAQARTQATHPPMHAYAHAQAMHARRHKSHTPTHERALTHAHILNSTGVVCFHLLEFNS